MRNLCLWTVIGLCGVGLIFDAEVRNDYYTAFSYLFPSNTKATQDLADLTRLALGLLMTLSIFNILSGLLFKGLSLFSFVVFSVVTHQQFVLQPSMNNKHHLCSIAIHIVLIFFCMDSIINTIVKEETRPSREKTRKFIENVKNQAESKTEQSTINVENQKATTISGKSKNQEQAKVDKKQAKKQQKPKKA